MANNVLNGRTPNNFYKQSQNNQEINGDEDKQYLLKSNNFIATNDNIQQTNLKIRILFPYLVTFLAYSFGC